MQKKTQAAERRNRLRLCVVEFWLNGVFCKQVKKIAKIKDLGNFDVRRAAHGTSGKPAFLLGRVWAEN